MLRVFIDTADVEEVRDAVSTGLVDGVATNPLKIASSGTTYARVVEQIRSFFDGPISVQAVGSTRDEICDCARRLNRLAPNLAIKVAVNREGLAAIKTLVDEGIKTNATLIFNPAQALMATLAGSPFISPFVSRARMTGEDGVRAIGRMRQLLDSFELTGVNMIAASIKDVEQAVASIIAGAHSVAVPFAVFEAMCDHPLTREGLEQFTELYRTIPS